MIDVSDEINSLDEKANRVYIKIVRLRDNPKCKIEVLENLEDTLETLNEVIARLEDLWWTALLI